MDTWGASVQGADHYSHFLCFLHFSGSLAALKPRGDVCLGVMNTAATQRIIYAWLLGPRASGGGASGAASLLNRGSLLVIGRLQCLHVLVTRLLSRRFPFHFLLFSTFLPLKQLHDFSRFLVGNMELVQSMRFLLPSLCFIRGLHIENRPLNEAAP